jgi:hypothetical protein
MITILSLTLLAATWIAARGNHLLNGIFAVNFGVELLDTLS